MEPFIGQICLFGFNFAPRGWAQCNGQLMSISQNTALFSLLGTQYGGDGQTTFALPDLRGRVALGPGQGPGLSSYTQGQVGGTETVTLNSSQIPAHSHSLSGSSSAANSASPTNNVLAVSTGSLEDGTSITVNAYNGGPIDTTLNASSIGVTGGNQPFDVIQPYLALNYCIALEGIFPSRS